MSRLEPIVGTEIIDDIRLGHSWFEYDTLKKFIQDENPFWFIEIGVHEGGLSYLLIPKLWCDYIGIEKHCYLVQPAVLNIYKEHSKSAELICADCFDDKIFLKIQNLPLKIIYCDGGNKVAELQHFKSVCLPGDVIMAHDYHDEIRKVRDIPREYFTPEVRPIDVEHLDNDKTFERLDEEIFKETRIIGWRKK